MVSKKKKKKKKSSPKLRLIFRPKSEIPTFFQPKNRWSPKKKKKKKSSPKLRLIFRPKSEILTFFQPKIRWSPNKKKKKVFSEIETDLPAKIGNSNAFSGRITTCTSQLRHPISFGGAVFNFSPKIGLKSTKNVRFCILHKPMGGSSPPWLRYWIYPPRVSAPLLTILPKTLIDSYKQFFFYEFNFNYLFVAN